MEQKLIRLWQRAWVQVQLLAAVDAQRVFELAETLEPMGEWLREPDALERCREHLETYLGKYPDGADYLRETLA